MKLTFIELPPFERYRKEHISDEAYRLFQNELLDNPEKGDVIQGTGGLRKIRLSDHSRHKGKRGGARAIYHYFVNGNQIWLFAAYGKGEKEDLNETEKRTFKVVLENLKALVRGNK